MSSPQQANKHAYAQRLVDARDELARAQLEAIGAVMPDLIGQESTALAHAAAVANLESFAALLEHGQLTDVSVPAAVSALVRRLAWADVDVDMVARAYRIGQEWLYEDIRAHCSEASKDVDVDEAVALLGELGHLVLRFSDLSTTLVIQHYQRERDELRRNALAKRAGLVRAVLERRPVDLSSLERNLGYRFAGTHTAFRIQPFGPSGTDAVPRLVDVASALIAALDNPGALIVQDQPDRLTLWAHTRVDPVQVDAIATYLRGDADTQVAVGSPGFELEGFRRTHRQADRASVVGPRDGDLLVAYPEVSLVALLLENPDAAREFVDEELGELAAGGELNQALRGTLQAFLQHQCRHLPTARATYLHRNTIAERIRRVEAILGGKVTGRQAELDAALRLHQHFFGDSKSVHRPTGTAHPQ